MIWTYERSFELARPVEEVFAFFTDPANLMRITPPRFRLVIEPPIPARISAGTELKLRLSWRGLPLRWLSRIDAWEPPHRFIDVQLGGPYKSWVHEHLFEDRAGSTLRIDRVRYGLRGGWPGALFQPMVQRQLEEVFAFREKKIRELLMSQG